MMISGVRAGMSLNKSCISPNDQTQVSHLSEMMQLFFIGNEMNNEDKIRIQQSEELDRLIAYAGSVSLLAEKLDVPMQTVLVWLTLGRISASMATEAERKTNGLFVRRDLRPDVITWKDEI